MLYIHIFAYALLAGIILFLFISRDKALRQRNRLAILAVLNRPEVIHAKFSAQWIMGEMAEAGMKISLHEFSRASSNLVKKGYVLTDEEQGPSGSFRTYGLNPPVYGLGSIPD